MRVRTVMALPQKAMTRRSCCNCDAKVNNGSGFWDGSAIGNVYMNCHTTGNTVKVLNNGTYYMCITEHTASALNEPGVGAEWEEYWVEITATTEDTAWTTATFYRGCGAINVANRAALTTIIGHYTEGGIEKGIIPGNSTMIFGGQAVANGRIVRHPNIGGATVVGSALSNSPSHWKHVNDADEEYGSALGSRSGYGSPEFFTFGHSNDSAQAPSIWKLRWNDTRNQYGYSREGGNDVFGLTGADFSQDGYSGAEHVIVPNGLLIGDDSGATPRYARIRSIQNNSAISGVVVRGDIFYYTEPVAGGKIGAVVVTAGTVGSDAVVKEFGVIDA